MYFRMKKLKVFECYAGYGGASFGLKKANISFECVGYSEIHKGQIKIYEQNHFNIKNYGDITKIDPNILPDFDLISGGFPCQDVSMAGLRDLNKGRTKSVFKMLDIIKIKKPKYVLLENVQGILSMLDGELLQEIIRYLKRSGYAVSYQLLKSKDYGTPQNRPRVWIAAEYNRDSFLFNPFPNKEELIMSPLDLLDDEVDKSYYLTKKQFNYSYNYSLKRNGKDITKYYNAKVCGTLLARNPSRNYHGAYLIKNVKGIRSLTEKEYFRLQGFFNDEINIEGISKTTAYFSAGNGWDINLVSKIFTKWLK